MKRCLKAGIYGIGLFLFLVTLTSSAYANLLSNFDFELGTTSTVSGTTPSSAATSWGQWINSSGSYLNTQLVTSPVYHGNYSIFISTNGALNGIYQYFNNTAHPDWPVTLGSWVYVNSGQVGIGVGNNSYGFATATSSNTNVWEYVEVTAPVSYHSNEVYIYSSGGGADYYADYVHAYPVPEPASLLLFGSGLLGAGVLARRKKN